MARALALVEYASGREGALHLVNVSGKNLFAALNSGGTGRQFFSNAGKIRHLQGKDDQEKNADYFSDSGHFAA